MVSTWEVEYTDDFGEWFQSLDEAEQDDVAAKVDLLEQTGPSLGRPHADTVEGSRYPNMKELRIKRDQIRVFFAFDPRRYAILLMGASKVGDDRFYERMIPIADSLYAEHLAEIGDR